MDPLILALIFAVVVIGVIFVFSSRFSNNIVNEMDMRIQEMAAALDLPAPESKKQALASFHTAELSGDVKGRAFSFTSFTRSAKTSDSFSTEFSWSIKRNSTAQLIISREGIISTFRKQFGVKDINVGDKTFDSTFLLRCDDENYAKKVLSDEIRHELIALERHLLGSLIIDNQEVQYIESGVLAKEKDLRRILHLVQLARLIAEQVEKIEENN